MSLMTLDLSLCCVVYIFSRCVRNSRFDIIPAVA